MDPRLKHPVENLIRTFQYKGVVFEVVQRPDVVWVGCVDYADNNTDESDIPATLKRYQGLVKSVPILEKINPDWSAALSIQYHCDEKPCGLMFANESYTNRQDERYDLFTQPGGLWLRVGVNEESDAALLGRPSNEMSEYFGILQSAALENGYAQNPSVPVEIEYHCHAQYDTPAHAAFAYIPVIERQAV